jgi:hypothetical protein
MRAVVHVNLHAAVCTIADRVDDMGVLEIIVKIDDKSSPEIQPNPTQGL